MSSGEVAEKLFRLLSRPASALLALNALASLARDGLRPSPVAAYSAPPMPSGAPAAVALAANGSKPRSSPPVANVEADGSAVSTALASDAKPSAAPVSPRAAPPAAASAAPPIPKLRQFRATGKGPRLPRRQLLHRGFHLDASRTTKVRARDHAPSWKNYLQTNPLPKALRPGEKNSRHNLAN